MPLKPFKVVGDDSEPTSKAFWNELNEFVKYVNELEARLNQVNADLQSHKATPKAHG